MIESCPLCGSEQTRCFFESRDRVHNLPGFFRIFRSGPFNFVRSVKYFLEEKGRHWPGCIRQIDWPRNKLIRRTLKPFFFLVDVVGFGDVMMAILRRGGLSSE